MSRPRGWSLSNLLKNRRSSGSWATVADAPKTKLIYEENDDVVEDTEANSKGYDDEYTLRGNQNSLPDSER